MAKLANELPARAGVGCRSAQCICIEESLMLESSRAIS